MTRTATAWKRVALAEHTVQDEAREGIATRDEHQSSAALLYATGGVQDMAASATDETVVAGSQRDGATAGLRELSSKIAAVVELPYIAPDHRVFIPLLKREGVVLEISDDEFSARLTNLLHRDDGDDDLGDLEATFDLEEVSPGDRDLLAEGAIFYWNIGYYDDPTGQRHRVSELRFRRAPSWQKRDLEAAKREAQIVREELGIR